MPMTPSRTIVFTDTASAERLASAAPRTRTHRLSVARRQIHAPRRGLAPDPPAQQPGVDPGLRASRPRITARAASTRR